MVAIGVLLAIVLSVVGTAIMGGIVDLVNYVGGAARPGMRWLAFLTILSKMLIAPAYGGFLATFVTARIFRKINHKALEASFITVVVLISIFFFFSSMPAVRYGMASGWQLVEVFLFGAGTTVGARFGAMTYGYVFQNEPGAQR